MRIPILSFFTGGGFLDIGFERAGFDIVWTNENNTDFADMYEYGYSSWRRSTRRNAGTPAEITNRHSITELQADEILSETLSKKKRAFFGIIGGPPCPDFSAGGKHAGGMGANGRLSRSFLNIVCEMSPTFFLMENVSGLWVYRRHREFLLSLLNNAREEGQYLIDFRILNALELGVPQDRHRLFVFGIKSNALHASSRKAILANEGSWFPWPNSYKYKNAKNLNWPLASPFGAKPRKPKNIPIELTVYPLLNGDNDPEKMPNGTDYFHPHSEKFLRIPEGDVSGKSFKRLHRFRYSPTAWYGNNEVHLHPWKPRRLSAREAMRIQSVPDSYVLPAHFSLQSKFKLIGNGVPCRMAERIAQSIFGFLARSCKYSD